MIDDAYMDVFDHALLLTADSDQAATVRLLTNRFPSKKITSIAPPGRPHCKVILGLTSHKLAINIGHLERCLFPKNLIVNGAPIAKRHTSYDPPSGWQTPTGPIV